MYVRICFIPMSKPFLDDESICLNNHHGFLPLDYNGHIAISASDKNCKNWSEMKVKLVNVINLAEKYGQTTVYPYPDDVVGSRNYCRATTKEVDENNKVDKGAWCWVSDTDWEYCTCNTGTCSNNVNGILPVGYQEQN